jgi:hypothetical protein
MDDGRSHDKPDPVPTALDGGDLGLERKLYCRELIARFGYALALNWNLGEENSQSAEQQRAMAEYIHKTDPYQHHIVVHTFPNQQDQVYNPLLGDQSVLTGVSLQNGWDAAHQRTLHWITASTQAGRPWVVANDEQNPASLGVPPDAGYEGHDGRAAEGGKSYTRDDIRRNTLWGTLLAGGAGVEYYFGYKLPKNDLICEDFRSRDGLWYDCSVAMEFFRDQRIPLARPGRDRGRIPRGLVRPAPRGRFARRFGHPGHGGCQSIHRQPAARSRQRLAGRRPPEALIAQPNLFSASRPDDHARTQPDRMGSDGRERQRVCARRQ